MEDSPLRKLDKRTIAIVLAVRDQKSILKGVGHFEDDGKKGAALRVEVSHLHGRFAIQLRANEWEGEIESGEQFGCDYVLHLSDVSVQQE